MQTDQKQGEVIKLLKSLGEKIDDLNNIVKDKTDDLYGQLFTLRTGLKELEKKMLRRFTEVRESQNIVIRFFDDEKMKFTKEYERTKRRLSQIENYLKLPTA